MWRRVADTISALIAFAGILLIASLLIHIGIPVGPVGFTVSVLAILFVIAKYVGHRNAKSAGQLVKQQAKSHLGTLARKRSQLISKDEYGRVKRDPWDREITMFLNEIVKPSMSPGEQKALVSSFADAMQFVDELAEREQTKRVGAIEYRDDLSPKEFEVFCAETLNRQGWTARATGQAGDQGADVLAEKSGRRVVIQCKKYTCSVGNGAVQEAHAAKAHYAAQIAVVVTNSTFTPSAKALAQSTAVLLMHPTDLANFDAIVIKDASVS